MCVYARVHACMCVCVCDCARTYMDIKSNKLFTHSHFGSHRLKIIHSFSFRLTQVENEYGSYGDVSTSASDKQYMEHLVALARSNLGKCLKNLRLRMSMKLLHRCSFVCSFALCSFLLVCSSGFSHLFFLIQILHAHPQATTSSCTRPMAATLATCHGAPCPVKSSLSGISDQGRILHRRSTHRSSLMRLENHQTCARSSTRDGSRTGARAWQTRRRRG